MFHDPKIKCKIIRKKPTTHWRSYFQPPPNLAILPSGKIRVRSAEVNERSAGRAADFLL